MPLFLPVGNMGAVNFDLVIYIIWHSHYISKSILFIDVIIVRLLKCLNDDVRPISSFRHGLSNIEIISHFQF